MESRAMGWRRMRGSGPAAWRAGAAVALVALLAGAVPTGAQQRGATARRERATTQREVCASCHEGVGAARERALSHADSVTCLTCHHVGFTNQPTEARSARTEACIGCHEELHPSHAGTAPAQDAPTCEACHSVHDDLPLAEAALPNERCASCHASPHRLHAEVEDAPACTACHAVHDDTPVYESDPRVGRACRTCHEAVHPSHPAGGQEAFRCTACHGLSPDAPATAADLSRPETCVSCHEDLPHAHATVTEDAPECADCHAFADDPPLPEAAALVSQRCGACHSDAIEAYRSGGHAAGLDGERPNADLPSCISCHRSHEAEAGGAAYVRLAATVRCVECHSTEVLATKYDLPANVGASYDEDFHGATVRFLWDHPAGEGQPDVMTCSDCHGAHEVGWRDDAVIAEVCARCHEEGDAKLAGAWLGHAPPGPRNQPLIWLVRLFYYVLIPFALTGLALNIAFHLVDQRRKGARVMGTEGMKRLRARLSGARPHEVATVQRFGRLERLEHLGSMTTFILLVVTGLPQTRPDLGISHGVIDLFGGIATARLVHRIAGFSFLALLLLHLTRTVAGALRKRNLPPMVPSRQDFLDTLATLKHYLRGTPRPKVGKFDFSEKFEYWGLLLGGTVMTVTGLVLVYPELVTRLVPGQVVAAFRVMHGMEATFAVLVIALWHSYGVMLRPEVFPLDTSIFTGRMSVERLKEEHVLEYERLFGEEVVEEEEAMA